jgi:processive rubber oxygenase RoxA-like protein
MRSFIALGAATVFLTGCTIVEEFLPPDLPAYQPSSRTVWLDQNWTGDARFWFHHASQGTSTLPVPYDWFMALEQPQLFAIGAAPLLSEPDYLARFGFISSPSGAGLSKAADMAAHGYKTAGGDGYAVAYDDAKFTGNPEGLPVGFARTKRYPDPVSGRMLPDQIGFTCAACHTGQLTYKGTNIRIDGGPAVTNLGDFRKVLGLALAYTALVPGRFDRFADRLLPPDHTPEDLKALKNQFDTLLEKAKTINAEMGPHLAGSVEEGFARLDALNRIGNQVFFNDLIGTTEEGFSPADNLRPTSAPVNYPHIWSTSWFDWVQYDASIMQPMIRNAGEALGVSARINLVSRKDLFASSVDIDDVFRMEEQLAGPDPLSAKKFRGLAAPEWPEEILGEIKPEKVELGREIYQKRCAGCHRPATDTEAFWSDRFWKPIPGGEGRYLDLAVIPQKVIGTDPAQSNILFEREVAVPQLLAMPEPKIEGGVICGGESGTVTKKTSFAWALAYVVERTVDHWYDSQTPPTPADRRMKMDGNRPNCVQAPRAYKARPLNGIWATAPFLHNGTVLTLHDLLGPADARPHEICLGDREFDAEKVGMRGRCGWGMTKIDTRVVGNLNEGHSFEDGDGPGIIGPAFTPAERSALIEYLKTL